jgi:hypothetical protein
MRIDGVWRLCDDKVVRPIFRGNAQAADGTWVPVSFLADSGADRTVFSAEALEALGLTPMAAAEQLGGVGGKAFTVLVDTKIHLEREGGMMITLAGHFAAFTELSALDMSVLGRDITNLFALIVDRPQDVVSLVGPGHGYAIATT